MRAFAGRKVTLMRHRIGNDINSHWVRFLDGKLLKVLAVLAFFFPTIAQVRVVANQYHDSTIIVFDGSIVDVSGAWSFADFPSVAVISPADGWDLRFLFKVVDVVENFVRDWQFFDRSIWKNAFDLIVEDVVFAVAPKVVNHHEAAIETVVSQPFHFLLIEFDAAGFDHVKEWVVSQVFVGQPHDHGIGIYFDGSELLESQREVHIAIGIVNKPASTAPMRIVLHPREGERVLLEALRILPLRDVVESPVVIEVVDSVSSATALGEAKCGAQTEQQDE